MHSHLKPNNGVSASATQSVYDVESHTHIAVSLNVDFVEDVNFTGEIYNHLVANEDEKQMLVDLVESQGSKCPAAEDVVAAKGKWKLSLAPNIDTV